jgi:hypothetical protein
MILGSWNRCLQCGTIEFGHTCVGDDGIERLDTVFLDQSLDCGRRVGSGCRIDFDDDELRFRTHWEAAKGLGGGSGVANCCYGCYVGAREVVREEAAANSCVSLVGFASKGERRGNSTSVGAGYEDCLVGRHFFC